jgi:hypothetical protein
MAKIVKDKELAQLTAQSDSDLPSETDDSFELSLESDSSDDPETAAEGDMQTEYSCDQLYSSSTGVLTKISCKNVSQYRYCLIALVDSRMLDNMLYVVGKSDIPL